MFERFTERARRVVALAEAEARVLDHDHIGTEHILLGLIQEGEGVAARTLGSFGVALDGVRQQVEEIVGQGQQTPRGHIPFTQRAKKVWELCSREALQLGHKYIGTEHILLGLIHEGQGVAAQVLVKLGADLNRVDERVLRLLAGYQGPEVSEPPPGLPPVLTQFGHNLTELARNGRLDPMVGREKEIERIVQVLSRRTKNNPVLVGETGVGKTTVLSGLARLILSGEVPSPLKATTLFALDLGLIVHGRRSRVRLESRFHEIEEAVSTVAPLVLVVDEPSGFHGVGVSEAQRDLTRLLRGMATRRLVRIVFSATPAEYDGGLADDPALARVFEPVRLSAPGPDLMVDILRGLRDRFESHHKVLIADEALTAAAAIAAERGGSSALARALDLLDEAGARLRTREVANRLGESRKLDEKIADIRRIKESAIDNQDFERAAHARAEEKDLLAQKVEYQSSDDMTSPLELDEQIVQAVAADVFGISPEPAYTTARTASSLFGAKNSLWTIC